MELFREGRNIRELFQSKLGIVRRKLGEYNYKQLKEFSADEIEAVSMLGLVEDVVIDFENPSFSTRLGKMTRHNPFPRLAFEKEYYEVDALWVDVKISVISGVDLLGMKAIRDRS